MTKGELLDLLAPFTDEIEVIVRDIRGAHFEVGNGLYGIRRDGEGCLSLKIGDRTSNPAFGHSPADQP